MEDSAGSEATSDAASPAEPESAPVVDLSPGTTPAVVDSMDSQPAVPEDDLDKLAKSKGLNLSDKAGRASFAQMLHKTWGDNARLSQEAKDRQELAADRERLRTELEKLRATPAATPSAPPPPPEPPPNVKALESHITAMKARVDSIPARENALFKQFDASREKVFRFSERLEMADEFTKPEWQAKIDIQLATQERLAADIAKLPDDKQLYEIELRRAESERHGMEKSYAEQEMARQAAGEETARIRREFPAEVENLTKRHAAEAIEGYDKFSPELIADVQEYVDNKLIGDLQRAINAGVDFKDIDRPGLVKAHLQRWAKANDLVKRQKLQQVSATKQPAPRSTPAPRQPQDQQPTSDPYTEYQLAKAERIRRAGLRG